jgi:NADP-dependent 3-hydroxy acid dehydrogenase YdfG
MAAKQRMAAVTGAGSGLGQALVVDGGWRAK